MSPSTRSYNLAARMGRWSANHWKTAVFGWLAFVVASFAVGTAVGTKYLDTNDSNVGEAARADKIVKEGFAAKVDEQSELVFIRSTTKTPRDPEFQTVIDDVNRTLARFPQVT